MHVFQQPVGNIQAQAALRIGFQDVAELPANGARRNPRLQPAHPARRNRPLHQPAEDAAHADVDIQHPQNVAVVLLADFKRDIGDADHFAALRVDNLLIQKIAGGAQHVLVGMVGREVFVAEKNAVERNGADLVVTDV